MKLEIKNLSKKFEKKEVLNNINLEVESGEVVSLVGRNGSGKTTLLKLITGIYQLDMGEITIDGVNIEQNNLKSNIIYIPDKFDYFKYTKIKNIIKYYALAYDNFDEKFFKKELEKKELEEDIQKKVIEKLGNNRKKRISIIIFLVLISLIAIISTCFSVIYMGKDVIVPNVYIGDINVGNMSKEKAKEKLETIYTEKASKEIKASLKDYEHIIKPEMVEFKVDINSAVDKAYMIGRERKYYRK